MRFKGLILILFLCAFLFGLIDLGPINVDVIKTVPQGRYSSIKIKITNTSKEHINSCQLTCVLFKDDQEIDMETHYVIKSTEGGLRSGDFLYFEYIFSVEIKTWNKIGFKIKSID